MEPYIVLYHEFLTAKVPPVASGPSADCADDEEHAVVDQARDPLLQCSHARLRLAQHGVGLKNNLDGPLPKLEDVFQEYNLVVGRIGVVRLAEAPVSPKPSSSHSL